MPLKRIFGKKKKKEEEEQNKTKLLFKNIKSGFAGAKKAIPNIGSAATAVKDTAKGTAKGLKSGISSVKKDPVGAAQGAVKAITTSGKSNKTSKSTKKSAQTFKKGSSAARRIEKRNRAIHGDKEIDALKARHKAWKEARRKKKK